MRTRAHKIKSEKKKETTLNICILISIANDTGYQFIMVRNNHAAFIDLFIMLCWDESNKSREAYGICFWMNSSMSLRFLENDRFIWN